MVMTRQVISSGGHDGAGAAAAADGRLAVEDEGAASGGISGQPQPQGILSVDNGLKLVISVIIFDLYLAFM